MDLPDPQISIAGLSRDAAVERARTELEADLDAEVVRAAVDRVAGPEGDGSDSDPDGDGARRDRSTPDDVTRVVSRGTAQSALGYCSKVVTTAESRTEFARDAVESAREAASDTPDLATVEHRKEGLAAELAAVEDRTDDLGADLGSLVDRLDGEGSLFSVGLGIVRLEGRANETARDADALASDAREFERWCTDPELRLGELAGDLDAVEEFLDGIAGTLDGIAGTLDGIAEPVDAVAGPDDAVAGPDDAVAEADPAAGGAGIDPGRAWFDASVRHRVAGPLLWDVRAELGDFRSWADRADPGAWNESGDAGTGGDDPGGRFDEFDARVDALDERRADLGERLDALASPEWRDRFGDRLADLDAELGGVEPPVDWGSVLATLADNRPDLEGVAGR